MRLHQHCITSAAVAGGLYAVTRSLTVSLAAFLSGVLVDIDHLVDYWRTFSFRLDIRHFFSSCNGLQLTSAMLIFHSYELVALLAVCALGARSAFLTGVTIGLAQHLIFDEWSNPVRDNAYFFWHRLRHGFRFERVFVRPQGE